MDPRGIGQIFLEPLDRLEHTLDARAPVEVSGRVERELLREVEPRELLPAALALGIGEAALHHLREDRRTKAPDPRRHVALRPLHLPLGLEWREDVIDEPPQTAVDRSLPDLADELELLERKEGAADALQTLDQREIAPRPPGETGLDPIDDRGRALVEAAEEAVAERDRDDQGAGFRVGPGTLLRGR